MAFHLHFLYIHISIVKFREDNHIGYRLILEIFVFIIYLYWTFNCAHFPNFCYLLFRLPLVSFNTHLMLNNLKINVIFSKSLPFFNTD